MSDGETDPDRAIPAALAAAMTVLAVPAAAAAQERSPDIPPAPDARRSPVVDTVAGDPVPDPYSWLEEPLGEEARTWIRVQNGRSSALLEALPAYDTLHRRLSEVTFHRDEVGRPSWRDDSLYVMKRPAGAERAALYARDGVRGGEEVVLDPASVSPDPTVTVDFRGFEAGGRYLVFGVRQGGEDESTVHLRDREAGRLLRDSLPRGNYGGLSFGPGDGGFYYVESYDDRAPVARWHELGTPVSADTVVYRGEEREDFLDLHPVADGRYLMATVQHGWRSTDVHLKDLEGGGGWRTLVQGLDARSEPRWRDSTLWLLTEHGAPNRRLVQVDPERPAPEQWTEILPERDEVLDGYTVAEGRLWARYITDSVVTRIRIHRTDGTPVRDLELPGKGSASLPRDGPDGKLFFRYESFTLPEHVFLYDPETTERRVWRAESAPVSTDDWVVELEWVTSEDGVRVPVHVVREEGVERSGENPTLLHGYGGFDVPLLPSFDLGPALWVEAGGVYALAHLRGGSEFGQRWHWQGMRGFKQNVFNDFIAAAEFLVADGWTRPERLAIRGGSNGGLLVGASLTQRPDLFGAVIATVPELDLVGYPNYDDINPPALEEYGDATVRDEHEWIIEWSPLQNVERGVRYPSVYLATGDMDTRVDPVQARKMTAALQWASASDPGEEPVLLEYAWRVGHSGGRPASGEAAFTARQLAYLDWQLGGPWTPGEPK